MKTQFLIAAPASGSGKTTVSRGLMALLRQQGYRVQPFKCGPDYIDTKFHEKVCGRPSVNLDTFMATPRHVRQLFARYSHDADVSIVEGMMGLFDGYDRDRGSSAEVARVLGLPVVLVVNARSAAYSLAPLLQGFANFRPDVGVAGVIFNEVGSPRHYAMLQQVCRDVGLACYGYLPKSPHLEQASRYLGLDFSTEAESGTLVELMGEHIDWHALLQLSASGMPSETAGDTMGEVAGGQPVRAAVARSEESFSFVYQEVLDSFAHVSFFNPEADEPVPAGIDLLYLPGGYPEKHLATLARAATTRRSIRQWADRGGRIVAECGGMMYLCRNIVADDGDYPMCGVLPYTITARRADRRLTLGYRTFMLDGREYRGHEFHYTQFLGDVPPSACQVSNARGEAVSTPVFRHHNVLASYTHLYQII